MFTSDYKKVKTVQDLIDVLKDFDKTLQVRQSGAGYTQDYDQILIGNGILDDDESNTDFNLSDLIYKD